MNTALFKNLWVTGFSIEQGDGDGNADDGADDQQVPGIAGFGDAAAKDGADDQAQHVHGRGGEGGLQGASAHDVDDIGGQEEEKRHGGEGQEEGAAEDQHVPVLQHRVGMMASPFFLLKSTIRTMRLTGA